MVALNGLSEDQLITIIEVSLLPQQLPSLTIHILYIYDDDDDDK